jgi:ubiquinone/menaquinone biosynthesis C-methylase UbiE
VSDAEAVEAFVRVASLPPMWALRFVLLDRAIRLATAGEAVDLGCGAGHLAVELAKRAPELRITGIDLSEEMTAAARSRAANAGLGPRVRFKQGDVCQLPFIDGSLDLVVSSLSLHHWSRPVMVLDEVCRVLRRPDPVRGRLGGAFVILDIRRDLSWPAWLSVWIATRVIVPGALRRINEPMASRDAAYTPAEASRLLDQSRLSGWRVSRGPLWLMIEGRVSTVHCGARVVSDRTSVPARRVTRLASGAEPIGS